MVLYERKHPNWTIILPNRLTSSLYLKFIRVEMPKLSENVKILFHHDDVPPHYHRDIRNRWINGEGPHRSLNLTPFDFYLLVT